jgi:hypothetical protein
MKLCGPNVFSLGYGPVAGCCEQWAKLVQSTEILINYAIVLINIADTCKCRTTFGKILQFRILNNPNPWFGTEST